MKKNVPTSCEEYSIEIRRCDKNFLAICIEIPCVQILSELEGEALIRCREGIQDYIEMCLDNDWSYPEPNEDFPIPGAIWNLYLDAMYWLTNSWENKNGR